MRLKPQRAPGGKIVMRYREYFAVVLSIFALVSTRSATPRAETRPSKGHTFPPVIPKMWDDAAMATLEVPLADPVGSPRHVSAEYYYNIPVRPIYKQYPVYAPGHEPPGYMDCLKQQEPQIVWGVDPKTGVKHAPPLATESDWIKAGGIVFNAAINVFEKGITFSLPD